MLIFTRNQKEKFIIGDDIIITVLGFRDGKVKIGIEAPKNVPIDREEIRKLKEKQHDKV